MTFAIVVFLALVVVTTALVLRWAWANRSDPADTGFTTVDGNRNVRKVGDFGGHR